MSDLRLSLLTVPPLWLREVKVKWWTSMWGRRWRWVRPQGCLLVQSRRAFRNLKSRKRSSITTGLWEVGRSSFPVVSQPGRDRSLSSSCRGRFVKSASTQDYYQEIRTARQVPARELQARRISFKVCFRACHLHFTVRTSGLYWCRSSEWRMRSIRHFNTECSNW